MIVVYTDGLCEPVNPGRTATFGYVIRQDDTVLARESGVVGKGPAMSNNVAEYAALSESLGFLLSEGKSGLPVEVRSDSRLVVYLMSEKWKFHGGLYAEKYREAKHLAAEFSRLSFKWIPREENEEADVLSREAYKKAM